MIGQSIKDAARKKSMYIVEHSGAAAMRAMYEPIWVAATVAVNLKPPGIQTAFGYPAAVQSSAANRNCLCFSVAQIWNPHQSILANGVDQETEPHAAIPPNPGPPGTRSLRAWGGKNGRT